MNRNDLKEQLLSQIVAAREEQGLTQADLASKLGVDRAYISRLETGARSIRLDALFDLADALGIDLEIGFSKRKKDIYFQFLLPLRKKSFK